MTRARMEELFLESGLDLHDDAELVDTLAGLAELDGPAPAPSPLLAALFAGAVPLRTPEPLAGPRKRAVVGVVVLALSGVGATGLSAAANTLPRGLQHQVSQFSQHYLPFDLPEPPAPAQPLGQVRVAPEERGQVPSSERTPGELDEASRSAIERPDGTGRSGTHRAGTDRGGASAPRPAPAAAPAPSHGPLPSASATASVSPTTPPAALWSPRPSGSPSASPADPTPSKGGPGRPGQGGPSKGSGGKPKPTPKPTPQPTPQPTPKPTPQPTPEPGSKPRPGKPVPQPLPPPGGQPGDGGSTPAPPSPTPGDPTPTIPLPDLPVIPDLPGTSTEGSGGSRDASGSGG